jgi:hypothetical protein
MTLNELIQKIHSSQSNSIEVKRLKVSHGNQGGAGDYPLLILKIDGKEIQFKLESNEWVSA